MITIWPAREFARGRRLDVPLSKVFERFRTPDVVPDEADRRGWAPATFRDDYRDLAHHERSFAAGLDVEGGATRFEDTRDLWSCFWCFVHTTYSHTDDVHRLRCIFPTTRPMLTAECYRVRAWLEHGSEEAGQCVDAKTKDPSRLWFRPSVAPGREYRWHENKGEVLDVDAVLSMRPATAETPHYAIAIPIVRGSERVFDRARRYLDACPIAISGSGGHNTTFLVAQKLVRGFALDEDIALSLLSEWNARCEPPWSEKELRHKIRQAAKLGRLPPRSLLDARRM